jgi:hypothetical protein
MSVDNIFLDIAREFPDNQFLVDNNVLPGTQNTATTDHMKSVATKIISMKAGEFDSKEIAKTVGGCAMNTSRAANFYL